MAVDDETAAVVASSAVHANSRTAVGAKYGSCRTKYMLPHKLSRRSPSHHNTQPARPLHPHK